MEETTTETGTTTDPGTTTETGSTEPVTTTATTSVISLPSGDIQIDYRADLGQLLTSLLLFTLIVIQSFKWVSNSLRERKSD